MSSAAPLGSNWSGGSLQAEDFKLFNSRPVAFHCNAGSIPAGPILMKQYFLARKAATVDISQISRIYFLYILQLLLYCWYGEKQVNTSEDDILLPQLLWNFNRTNPTLKIKGKKLGPL